MVEQILNREALIELMAQDETDSIISSGEAERFLFEMFCENFNQLGAASLLNALDNAGLYENAIELGLIQVDED